MNAPRERVLSRHRLPTFYRVGLALLWLLPVGIFILTDLLALLRALQDHLPHNSFKN